ncbi:MAG: DedA family protein [Candidatus Gracilibacteria bacterium]|nr:DedA family protein [Candidatus Gracilibacteria bacterium]
MEYIVTQIGFFNYIIAFMSSFIEGFPILGVLLPGQNIMLIVGGFYGKISITNLITIILLAGLGGIIGNLIGYILGKKYGESFFDKYGDYIGIGKTEIEYLKVGIEKWGALGITLGKFHPLTRSFLPFIAGSAGMSSKKFMFYNALGSFIRAFTIIIFGVVFVKYYQIFIEYSGTIMLGIMALIGLYIYIFKKKEFLKYWEEKNKEIQEKYNNK